MRRSNATRHARGLVSHLLGWSSFAASLLLLVAAVGAGAATFEHAYADRIIPGVRIGPMDVGGATRVEATAVLQAAVDTFLAQGLTYTLDDHRVTLDALVTAAQDIDLSYPIVTVDVPRLVDAAFTVGHDDALPTAWTERVRGLVGHGRVVRLAATVNRDRLARALAENFAAQLPLVRPPRLESDRSTIPMRWVVVDGHRGRGLRMDAVVGTTVERIAALDPTSIPLPTEDLPLPYTTTDLTAALPALDAALSRAPLILLHSDGRWTIDAPTLAGWVTFVPGTGPAFDPMAIDVTIASIARAVERPTEDARLTIDPMTKRVREFRQPRVGIRIDRAALRTALDASVFGTATPLVRIPTVEDFPTITLDGTNDLGIRERLGVGRTSFARSPLNRRHNIGVGARLLNGLLITPGEEFSTVAALSPFNATREYKPELVIKGNRTIPEFGGGLCQVSTTLFRTVLAAGLPITERANHAYRVPYYEPPVGVDATIYGPKPDFRFVNDTGHHLLLTTRVLGDVLEYELWGTKDGRTVAISESEIFNVVPPPPKKIVETEDLPPGTQKCTERSHTGADAKFTYTVTHADDRKVERVFRSHYRPWQAVCLVGKQPAANPPPPVVSPDAVPPRASASPPEVPEPVPHSPPANQDPAPVDPQLGGAN